MAAELVSPVFGLDLESCEGVVIVHADGRRECSEHPGCPADLVGHAVAMSCHDALGLCCAVAARSIS